MVVSIRIEDTSAVVEKLAGERTGGNTLTGDDALGGFALPIMHDQMPAFHDFYSRINTSDAPELSADEKQKYCHNLLEVLKVADKTPAGKVIDPENPDAKLSFPTSANLPLDEPTREYLSEFTKKRASANQPGSFIARAILDIADGKANSEIQTNLDKNVRKYKQAQETAVERDLANRGGITVIENNVTLEFNDVESFRNWGQEKKGANPRLTGEQLDVIILGCSQAFQGAEAGIITDNTRINPTLDTPQPYSLNRTVSVPNMLVKIEGEKVTLRSQATFSITGGPENITALSASPTIITSNEADITNLKGEQLIPGAASDHIKRTYTITSTNELVDEQVLSSLHDIGGKPYSAEAHLAEYTKTAIEVLDNCRIGREKISSQDPTSVGKLAERAIPAEGLSQFIKETATSLSQGDLDKRHQITNELRTGIVANTIKEFQTQADMTEQEKLEKLAPRLVELQQNLSEEGLNSAEFAKLIVAATQKESPEFANKVLVQFYKEHKAPVPDAIAHEVQNRQLSEIAVAVGPDTEKLAHAGLIHAKANSANPEGKLNPDAAARAVDSMINQGARIDEAQTKSLSQQTAAYVAAASKEEGIKLSSAAKTEGPRKSALEWMAATVKSTFSRLTGKTAKEMMKVEAREAPSTPAAPAQATHAQPKNGIKNKISQAGQKMANNMRAALSKVSPIRSNQAKASQAKTQETTRNQGQLSR